MTEAPFNPLDKRNLGISVAKALLDRPARRLDELDRFVGAGIYAIYYTGPFACYDRLTQFNRDGQFSCPIYVGKAIPPGGRKGGDDLGQTSMALARRLAEHAESVHAADNLAITDFHCRYLVVDDIWIPLGESLLISLFSPIWNKLVDGFGNHDPGRGRHQGRRSRWDVLHPGRSWAGKCQPREETAEDIAAEVSAWLATAPLAPSLSAGGA